MSRIGNMPVTVPEGVEVKIDGQHITVKGPKGSLERDIHPNIKVELDGNEIKVSRPDDSNQKKSLHGTTRALIHNMVEGVVNEFKVRTRNKRCWIQSTKTRKQTCTKLRIFSPSRNGCTRGSRI